MIIECNGLQIKIKKGKISLFCGYKLDFYEKNGASCRKEKKKEHVIILFTTKRKEKY